MRHAEVLVMDLSNVPLLGVTVCLSLENMVKDAVSGGGRVIVAGATGRTRERLEKFGFFTLEGLEERPDRKEALERTLKILTTSQPQM